MWAPLTPDDSLLPTVAPCQKTKRPMVPTRPQCRVQGRQVLAGVGGAHIYTQLASTKNSIFQALHDAGKEFPGLRGRGRRCRYFSPVVFQWTAKPAIRFCSLFIPCYTAGKGCAPDSAVTKRLLLSVFAAAKNESILVTTLFITFFVQLPVPAGPLWVRHIPRSGAGHETSRNLQGCHDGHTEKSDQRQDRRRT